MSALEQGISRNCTTPEEAHAEDRFQAPHEHEKALVTFAHGLLHWLGLLAREATAARATLPSLEDEAAAAPSPRQRLRAGALFIDPDAHSVSVSGTSVVLSALEFRLLCVLAARAGHTQSRDALMNQAWPGGALDCYPRVVDTAVRRLRAKLGAAAAQIQTVRGVGYCLVAPEGQLQGLSRRGSAEREAPPVGVASFSANQAAERLPDPPRA